MWDMKNKDLITKVIHEEIILENIVKYFLKY